MKRKRGQDITKKIRESPACEMCGRSNQGDLQAHHVWTRGAGCPDEERFIVALCPLCHTLYQNDPEPAFIRGVLAMVIALRRFHGARACVQEAVAIRQAVWKWRQGKREGGDCDLHGRRAQEADHSRIEGA